MDIYHLVFVLHDDDDDDDNGCWLCVEIVENLDVRVSPNTGGCSSTWDVAENVKNENSDRPSICKTEEMLM